MKWAAKLTVLVVFMGVMNCSYLSASKAIDQDREYIRWTPLPDLPESLGVAGPFVGVHHDVLLVAGGANFTPPVWESEKQWLDKIWALEKIPSSEEKTAKKYQWIDAGRLDVPVAYGAAVSTEQGVVCIGGCNSEQVFRNVFALAWDPQKRTVCRKDLPSLPKPCVYTYAAKIGSVIYVAGGQSGISLDTAMTNFWSLDLSKEGTEAFAWKEWTPWPGPSRAFNITVAQHNGMTDCIYVISGRRLNPGADAIETEFLQDVYEYNPLKVNSKEGPWRKRCDVPACVMAGAGIDIGQSHIFILSGADSSLFFKSTQLKDDHPGFPLQAWAYHTITDTWIDAGRTPANQVTTIPVKWGNSIILASGEIKPRVRSPKIWEITPVTIKNSFGIINFTTLGIYLFLMIAVGFYFSARNKNTDDFFRGGQRIPGWAAGLSIFATMLSSITFIAIPAKVYATDWTFFIVNMMAVAVAPFVMWYILPFYRRIDATSAYEYLEKRFHVAARLFAGLSFVLFQTGRMAIVIFLPSLALSAITNVSVPYCILIMGVVSIIYCTLGGIEAVIWTDAVQSFVLLGGAFMSLAVIILGIQREGGEFFAAACSHNKFHMINWDFSTASYMTASLWVMVIGGIGQSLVPYVSDQAVVQRYLSVRDIKTARTSILTNAIIVIPATILFFGIGTALFVFYRVNPENLDPTYQNDAIFPLFIARQLPVGISGLVVAGIFAAAQSTISTSMNSISTVIVTDFVKRFSLLNTEKGYLNVARFCTVFFGILGTGLSLLLASADIKSLWESFMEVLGLFGGSMCGLFLLGIFTRRVGTAAALAGAAFSVVILFLIQGKTHTSVLIYASIGIAVCMLSGYLLSFVFPQKQKDLAGLTIYTV